MVDRFFADRSSGRNGTVECVLASDYDALAAELVALKENYKFSVAAHDEATQQVVSLQNKWASRPLSSEDQAKRIAILEVYARHSPFCEGRNYGADPSVRKCICGFNDLMATAEPPTPNSEPVSSKSASEPPHCPTCGCGLTSETKGEQG